jgi:serine/threonine protein kinase
MTRSERASPRPDLITRYVVTVVLTVVHTVCAHACYASMSSTPQQTTRSLNKHTVAPAVAAAPAPTAGPAAPTPAPASATAVAAAPASASATTVAPMPSAAAPTPFAVAPQGRPTTADYYSMWNKRNFQDLVALMRGGRYVILNCLSPSLFGAILLAHDRVSHALVTIKVSVRATAERRESLRGHGVVEDLEREVHVLRYLTRLSPPPQLGYRPICELVDSCMDEQYHYIITQFQSGGELFAHSVQAHRGGAVESISQKYASQLVVAVDWLHSHGIAHGDISMENVCVDAYDRLHLIDFGSALIVGAGCTDASLGSYRSATIVQPPVTRGRARGKMAYNSPELMSGNSWHAFKNDVFQMGVVIFSLMLGGSVFVTALDDWFHMVADGRWLLPSHFGIWCPPGNVSSHMSGQAKAFLNSIIKYEDKRASIEALLRHPWLAAFLGPSTPSAPSGAAPAASTASTASTTSGAAPVVTFPAFSTLAPPPVSSPSDAHTPFNSPALRPRHGILSCF